MVKFFFFKVCITSSLFQDSLVTVITYLRDYVKSAFRGQMKVGISSGRNPMVHPTSFRLEVAATSNS